jgi:hypothetical protein
MITSTSTTARSNAANSGHSADVRIHLIVNGASLPVAQLGPDFFTLREPAELPPTEAEIVMSIDGEVSRWTVYLPNGVRPNDARTKIA